MADTTITEGLLCHSAANGRLCFKKAPSNDAGKLIYKAFDYVLPNGPVEILDPNGFAIQDINDLPFWPYDDWKWIFEYYVTYGWNSYTWGSQSKCEQYGRYGWDYRGWTWNGGTAYGYRDTSSPMRTKSNVEDEQGNYEDYPPGIKAVMTQIQTPPTDWGVDVYTQTDNGYPEITVRAMYSGHSATLWHGDIRSMPMHLNKPNGWPVVFTVLKRAVAHVTT